MTEHNPRVDILDNGRWTNWHQSITQDLDRFVHIWNDPPEISTHTSYNATTNAIQNLIQECLDAGSEMRGLGGGWSWSDVLATSGTLLNTMPLNYRFRFSDDMLHDNCAIEADDLYFVQCGTSIASLNRFLETQGKSIKTSGASNGQTIAGAMSTGTGGSALYKGSVQDFVRAIHLIPSPDRSLWIEPARSRITKNSLCERAFEATLVVDDDVFDAALVSFGSFGLIAGVVIEVEKLHYLSVYWKQVPRCNDFWDAVETLRLEQYLEMEFAADNLPAIDMLHHFDVLINPHDCEDHAYVKAMYKSTIPWPGKRLCGPGRIQAGDGVSEFAGLVTDWTIGTSTQVPKIMLSFEFDELHGESGTRADVFRDTFTRGKTASSAIGVCLQDVQSVMCEAIRLIRKYEVPVLAAIRFVKPTKALLGWTRFKPQTAVVEFDGPNSSRVQKFYRRLWTYLRENQQDIPHTYHWGKLHDQDQDVRQRFDPDNVRRWLCARDEVLRTPQLKEVFANDLLKTNGLNAGRPPDCQT